MAFKEDNYLKRCGAKRQNLVERSDKIWWSEATKSVERSDKI